MSSCLLRRSYTTFSPYSSQLPFKHSWEEELCLRKFSRKGKCQRKLQEVTPTFQESAKYLCIYERKSSEHKGDAANISKYQQATTLTWKRILIQNRFFLLTQKYWKVTKGDLTWKYFLGLKSLFILVASYDRCIVLNLSIRTLLALSTSSYF